MKKPHVTASDRTPEIAGLELSDLGTRRAGNEFFLGLIFNQGERAARAWRAPRGLRRRLGTLNASVLSRLDVGAIADAIAEQPSLHRHGLRIAQYVHASMRQLDRHYGGDARNIWSPVIPLNELLERLQSFHGIGPHKATVGVFLLTVKFGVAVIDDGTRVDIRKTCPALFRYFAPVSAPVLLGG